MTIRVFSDEQARALVNLRQRYEVWMKAECGLAKLPYGLARKEVSGRAYLYEIRDRKGNAKSLGQWSEAFAEKLDAYRHKKETRKASIDATNTHTEEHGSHQRVLALPITATEAGPRVPR